MRNSGGHLRKILTKRYSYDFYDGEDFPIYARTFYENCPLIEYLPPILSSSNFDELEKSLKTCQKLKLLSIRMVYVDQGYDYEPSKEAKLKHGESYQEH